MFTPGSFPVHTYVDRQDKGIEERLSDALETVGTIVTLAGPSKSGKTVLVERVVGKDNLITITGAGDEINKRIDKVCEKDGKTPVGSSVSGSCLYMARLARDHLPTQRVIDWDEEKGVLDIPDPYLLFYLRWSGHV